MLEAGLGGEFDSTTTCVKRDLTLFSAIDIDHQEFLGESLESIAKTKLNAMAKKAATKDKPLNLESILFNCRDYLRGSAALNDKRDIMLTLVFLRFIGEKFDEAQAKMRQECINRGIEREDVIEKFLQDPKKYKNIVFVPEKKELS